MTVIDAPTLEKLTYNDENHAYWITPGGRCKSVTTVAKLLDDSYNLERWKMRQVAIGLAACGGSVLDEVAAHFDDRDALNGIVEKALVHAKSHEAAARGTAMHRATERADLNEAVLATPLIAATIDAWRTALDDAGLDVLPEYVECIVVYPDAKVAGRLDRIVRRRSDGRLFVLDLKSGAGAVKYPHSIAIQLALYAHAPIACRIPTASGATSEFFTLPDELDRTTALVVHMPTPEQCSILPIDIAAGWEMAHGAVFPTLRWHKRTDLVGPPLYESTTGTAHPSTTAPGAGTTAPGAKLTRREQVIERLRVLKAIDDRWPTWVAAHWPENVPALASKALLTPTNWAAIDAVLSAAEAEAQAPFVPAPADDDAGPGWVATLAAAPAVEEPAPVAVHDEGDTVGDEEVEAMLARLGRLTGVARSWATDKLREARDAGVPVSLRASRSVRAFEISRALATWAETYESDDELFRYALCHVVGDDRMQPGFPAGAVLGTLATDEATALVGTCLALESGRLVLVMDGQGERLEEMVA